MAATDPVVWRTAERGMLRKNEMGTGADDSFHVSVLPG
jgi:hypothetical protein